MEATEHDMISCRRRRVGILGIVVTDQAAVNEETGISLGLCVKEPSCSNNSAAVSEEAMLGDGYTGYMIKKEVAAGPECKNAQPTCSNSTDDTSMAAMLDALYADHVIKEELVLGPESIQQPHISYEWVPDAVTCPADGAISTRHEHTYGAPSNTEYDAIRTINTHTMLLPVTEALSENSLDIQAMNKGHCCQICQKLFTRPSGLKRHMRVHGEKDVIMKPHHCQICHKYFTRSSDLKRHLRLYSGEKHVCQLCDKEFSQMTDLKRHERLHIGDKLYSCEICKKKFPEMRRLKSHRLIHSSKLYSCDICKKEFKDMLTLEWHKNTHTGGKSYTCDVCKKEFIHLSTLNTHKRIHTGETPYFCELCDVAFPGLRQLKIHNLFSHADTTETWDL